MTWEREPAGPAPERYDWAGFVRALAKGRQGTVQRPPTVAVARWLGLSDAKIISEYFLRRYPPVRQR